jgi:hypothetical protein
MSPPEPRLPGGAAELHPVVLGRRLGDGALVAFTGLVTIGLALGIALAMPKPNYPLVLGGVIGLLALAALITSPRLDLTAGGLVFYLGCMNGPLKLISATGTLGSALKDVLIVAIVLGVALRQLVSRQRFSLPPLSGWAVGFVVVVALEAFNPKTLNILKVGAGLRDQLQYVPFFIFGWLLVRSKARLRKVFLLLGVIALANGIVSSYQSRLSPAQAASWGAGYEQKYEGADARTFKSEGEGHVRPTGLGDESGGGGGVGIVAIAGVLALLATTRKRKWLLALLLFGSIAAIATSLGRIELVGGVLAVIAYAVLTGSAGRAARRPLRYLLVALALAIPFGVIYVTTLGEGTFARYSGLLSGEGSNNASYKEDELKQIPKEVGADPFGFGLGTAGPAAGFGGKSTELLEGHNVNAETTYNYIVKEVGLPGVLVWAGAILSMIGLAFRRIRTLADTELQIYLAAVFAPVIALFFMSFEGPVTQSEALSPFYWFALGVAGYWLAGPGWQAARRRISLKQSAPAVPVAA